VSDGQSADICAASDEGTPRMTTRDSITVKAGIPAGVLQKEAEYDKRFRPRWN
jgi:hypothetical protein